MSAATRRVEAWFASDWVDRLVGRTPGRHVELGLRHRLAGGGSGEAHPLLPPIVEHAGRRRQQDGGALRAGVDHQPRLAAVRSRVELADVERVVRRRGFQPIAADDLDEIGLCPRAEMLIVRPPAGGPERVCAHRLDADLEGPGFHGLLDVTPGRLPRLGTARTADRGCGGSGGDGARAPGGAGVAGY